MSFCVTQATEPATYALDSTFQESAATIFLYSRDLVLPRKLFTTWLKVIQQFFSNELIVSINPLYFNSCRIFGPSTPAFIFSWLKNENFWQMYLNISHFCLSFLRIASLSLT